MHTFLETISSKRLLFKYHCKATQIFLWKEGVLYELPLSIPLSRKSKNCIEITYSIQFRSIYHLFDRKVDFLPLKTAPLPWGGGVYSHMLRSWKCGAEPMENCFRFTSQIHPPPTHTHTLFPRVFQHHLDQFMTDPVFENY